ncbi:MAG: diacylglycerol kinase family protein [Cyanobacteria bacterium HKST-UBA03]|nr:diacylglycerol kinase family protein [Cyanobacteria bacterium HKST-UBA03]
MPPSVPQKPDTPQQPLSSTGGFVAHAKPLEGTAAKTGPNGRYRQVQTQNQPDTQPHWLNRVIWLSPARRDKALHTHSLLTSFGYAFEGLHYAFSTQRNFRIHCQIALFAVGLSLVLAINPLEWVAIGGCIGLVLLCELMNTALEYCLDTVVGTRFDHRVKVAKDTAAAAVVVAVFTSVVTGVWVFLPRLIDLLKQL